MWAQIFWRDANISLGANISMGVNISWARIFHGREYFMGANISWARIFHGREYFDVSEYFMCKWESEHHFWGFPQVILILSQSRAEQRP